MTTLPVGGDLEPLEDVRPRRLARRATGADRVFEVGSRAVGTTVLLITGGIGVFLAWQATPTLRRYGWSFFTETAWQPEADPLGIGAVLVGTVSVALVAMVIAFPLSLATALFISEYAPARIKSDAHLDGRPDGGRPLHHLRAVGLLPVMPHAADLALWLHRNLGFLPFFDVGCRPERRRVGQVPLHRRAPSAPASPSR